MDIADKIGLIENKFNEYKDWEDKYRVLIKMGKSLSSLKDVDQVPKFEIKGCQSKVWLKPSLKSSRVHFEAGSDAILVKGIIGV